ncbi:hypothetical protein DL95DRAFT_361368 [Leptodontidium sp. 2 PMI_412]|nr:hypothetical protein DL95DRAFT_361368 [Leptodontidium sp. 2 PMI_412]
MAEHTPTKSKSTHSLVDGTPELANGAAPSTHKVIVIGAGPVGLFLTYLLAKQGIQVDVVERFDGISKEHRAAGYYGGGVFALKDAGLLHLAAKRGHVAEALGWRAPAVDDGKGGKTFGRLLCAIPFAGTEEHPELGMLLFPQTKLCELLEEQIIALGQNRVAFHFGAEICGIDQLGNGDAVTATIRDMKTGVTRDLTGNILVGADGGKSATRSLLGISLQGHTWPERLIAVDVNYAIEEELPKVLPHHVVDPIWWATMIPLERPVQGKPSIWRFCMAIDPLDQSPVEVLLSEKYLANMIERHMVGKRPLKYEVTHKAAYKIHQRLANKMAVGRCVLIGDAAHLNNPMGALGLCTGLLDAEALAETLQMIFHAKKPISILEAYSHERRRVFQMFVDPTSKANKLRLQQSPEYADDDWMVRTLQNPTPEVMKEFFSPYMASWRSDMRAVVAKKEKVDADKARQ